VTGGARQKKNAQTEKVATEEAEVVRQDGEEAEAVRQDVEEAEVEREFDRDTDVVTDKVGDTRGAETRTGTIGAKITGQRQPTARYLEKQRTTRIIAAESLLRDELKKVNPSLASVTAFRKAAYGDETMGETESSAGRSIIKEVSREKEESLLSACSKPTEPKLQIEEDESGVETEIVVGDDGGLALSDDAAMSICDSEEDDTGTDGFSRGDRSRSCGESVVSRASRKRAAKESPERELVGTNRKKIPGAVTRSDGGCQIYVPPALLKGVKGSGKQTAVFGGDASMRDVPIVATETLTENVHTSTEVVKSGAPEGKSILEKSECTLKPVAECGATVAISGTSVELDTTNSVGTSNATVGMSDAVTTDTCEVLLLDVTAKVAGPPIITGMGVI